MNIKREKITTEIFRTDDGETFETLQEAKEYVAIRALIPILREELNEQGSEQIAELLVNDPRTGDKVKEIFKVLLEGEPTHTPYLHVDPTYIYSNLPEKDMGEAEGVNNAGEDFKGTPGPWEVLRKDDDRVYGNWRGNRVMILSAGASDVSSYADAENARLASASLEMLEVCQLVADFLGVGRKPLYAGWSTDLKNKAELAIKKALGD